MNGIDLGADALVERSKEDWMSMGMPAVAPASSDLDLPTHEGGSKPARLGPWAQVSTPVAMVSSVSSLKSHSHTQSELKAQRRRAAVERYLIKKKRRRWFLKADYSSRQRVARARPRVKGRFIRQESEFVPITELMRKSRQQQDEEGTQALPQVQGIDDQMGQERGVEVDGRGSQGVSI
ncbi:unnamed protein product [Discosporangium mesarthrocarpum]